MAGGGTGRAARPGLLLAPLPRATDAPARPRPAPRAAAGASACAERAPGGGARTTWRGREGRCDLQGVASQ